MKIVLKAGQGETCVATAVGVLGADEEITVQALV